MEEEHQLNEWVGYVDWRNRPALKLCHGGLLATSVVLVVEKLEKLTYLSNANNLVLYLLKYMNFSPSKSANTVTNFMGTTCLLAVLGGFLSDALFIPYHIYLITAVVEFVGLVILTVQARLHSLKPPACDLAISNIPCHEAYGKKAAMLFIGLYLVALGVGGVKGSLPTHRAHQLGERAPQGSTQGSTLFNYFVFSLSCVGLIGDAFVAWIEYNKGWELGFGISTLTIFLCIPIFLFGLVLYKNKIPSGSPLTTIFKVLVGATLNTGINRSSSNAVESMVASPTYPTQTSNIEENVEATVPLTRSLKFLNRAVEKKPVHGALECICTAQQVEDVKIVLKILPIFACTIMLSCCLAQLSTFSVLQAATMNTKLGSLKVPPTFLLNFHELFIMIFAPVYNHFINPFAAKVTKNQTGFTHLQRIGIGLVLSIIAMASAALVEVKRKTVAYNSGLLESANPLPITFFWIGFQYLFLGSAHHFTLAGLSEFFCTEAPVSMRSLASALYWASLAMGYYLSTVIVSIVNSGYKPWLSGWNLNHYHLERFYWLLCVLSGINFLLYLFWANKYKY